MDVNSQLSVAGSTRVLRLAGVAERCPSRLIRRMRNQRAELSLDAEMMGQRSLIGRKVSITAKQCMRNEKRGVAAGHVQL
ncbi:hypothetical protein CEXT_343761 [Caerostris extrusa]|uniref:Uncharacterized protein n=1 Tax=Caerostris extrusa TaxID=172846 RepID=A0AAV4TF15_CAEEX|nr:hypothetical protein CEXT_343761 [Caerostris extrusa]